MFKFGFSDNVQTENDLVEKLDKKWEPSAKVQLSDIQLKCKDNSQTFSVGNITIKYIPLNLALSDALNTGSENIKIAEEKHSDLIPAVYEGGLKIWECTHDLANYLQTLNFSWNGKNVLDLGCGAGLLGIFALIQGAHVVFQDYNQEVVEKFTGPNVLLNGKNIKNAQFYYGDWENFLQLFLQENPNVKFDIILTSETIYNPENYKKLHNTLSGLLKETGICYLAAKSVYFGVGGSTQSFINFINKNQQLESKLCHSISTGINREILKITKMNAS